MHKYGWKKDIPDTRDFKFRLAEPVIAPDKIDLQDKCPPVYNQGNLSSCSANAISAVIEFDQLKQGLKAFIPSRLFIYYNERDMEGDTNEDNGASLRDGIKCINSLGVCEETMWPYDEGSFSTKPLVECYTEAKLHPSVLYHSVNQTQEDIENVLASGYPIIFGFKVYDTFEDSYVAHTGMLPMPENNEQCEGGHAVLLVGYDRATKLFKVRNSWGFDWGHHGYFWMPYDYVLNPDLASDFWVIQLVK